MKKTRLLALATALLMTVSLATAEVAAAPAEAPAAQPEPVVLATVNGEDISKADADALIPMLVNYKYIADSSDYKSTVEFLVRQKTLAKKIKDIGFDQFAPEEVTAFE